MRVKAHILSRFHVALLSIACLAVSARAEVWQSQEFNFGITLPESGWTRLKPPSEAIQLMVRSKDQTKLIHVTTVPTGDHTPESVTSDFIKNFFAHGTGKIKIEERITINGHEAFRLKDIGLWAAGKCTRLPP